jgi:endonuclease/exonuclease/phosphatase family metal-dependent hydrolase
MIGYEGTSEMLFRWKAKMKRSRSIGSGMLVLIASFVLFVPEAAQGQQFLKVMTYNIQGMRPGSDPGVRLANIISNLKRINPDILGLQEVNETKGGDGSDNQARAIAESLSAFFGVPYEWHCGPGHDAWSGAFTEYNAIVTKHVVRSVDVQILEFSDFPREVLWNLIETPVGMVHFFTTHLSTVGPAPRARQGAEVRAFVQAKELTEQGVATIVTGDFNDVATSAVITAFTVQNEESGYSDTYAELCPGASGFTVDALSPVSRIDYIFLKRTGVLVPEASTVECNVPYAPGKYSSDHYAVVTTLSSRPLLYNRSLVAPPSLLDSRDTTALQLACAARHAVTVSSVSLHYPEFSILAPGSFPLTLPNKGSRVRLLVEFAPSSPGLHRDTIAIHTDDPAWPVLTIPIEGRGVATVVPSLPGLCYAISRSSGADLLWHMNPSDATVSQIGTAGVNGITAMSVRPSTGDIYGVIPDSLRSSLVRVSADSGYAASAGSISIPFARAITFGNGDTCYIGTQSGSLYSTVPGQAVPVELGHLDGFGIGGMCYDRATHTIYVSTYMPPYANDSIYVVDPRDGVFHFLGSTGLWTVTSSLAMDSSGQLYGLTGTDLNLVIHIDKSTGYGEPASYDPLQGFAALAFSPTSAPSDVADQPLHARFRFRLLGNYPNPFNPTTSIGYAVGEVSSQWSVASGVRIAVYDILSREVALLVDEHKLPGIYKVTFDARDLATGVYFCRMQSGAFMETRKLLLMR